MTVQEFDHLRHLQEWRDILHRAEACIQVNPSVGRFHYYRGFALFHLQEFELAQPSLQAAHILDETQEEAVVMDAMCLEKLHRYRDAMDLVKEWRTKLPNEYRLEGLQEFLSAKWESQEHDGWERSRLAGSHVVFTQGSHS